MNLPGRASVRNSMRSLWWDRGLTAIAGAAVVMFASLLFGLFGDGDRPEIVWAGHTPEVRTGDLLRAVSGALNAPARRGGRARLLINGDEFEHVVLETIRSARRSVHFMTYVWEPGEMSDRLFDALEERARAGVAVRLMLDGHGGRRAPKDRIAALRASGGQVAMFNPISWNSWISASRRNHRRAIVIDGTDGFTGGAGVADVWLGDAQGPDHWRDELVHVDGPLARSLQAAFAQLWSATTGEVLAGPEIYPAFDSDSEEDDSTVALHVSITSSPSQADHPLRKLWWLSFAGARERIWITTPYFVPEPAVVRVLSERARAGVDVRVLTAGEHVDVKVVRWAGRAHYEELLEAGVRIFEYQPTLIHSKLTVIDGIWSIVGSANLDVRSIDLNQENVLALLDVEFASLLEQVFRQDLEASREIVLEEWRERGLLARARGIAASLLEEQL